MKGEILNSLVDQVAVVNKSGEIIEENEAWKHFYQQNGEELTLGKNYFTHLFNSNSHDAYDGIIEVINGQIPNFHTVLSLPSGLVSEWFSVIMSPVIEKEKIKGAIIVQRNVNKYEKERREMFDVLESMSDAFVALDENWHFTYVNKEAERLLTSLKEDLLGKELWQIFPEALNSAFEENYTKTMFHRETTIFEAYFEPLCKWFEVHAYPRETGGISIYFNDIDEKKVKEDQLWDTAHHDYLTEVPNRLLLYKFLELKVSDGLPFVLFFIDLNNFKFVNDAYGHDTGDLYLLEVTKRLTNDLPDKYFLSRFGGDEFILCTDYVDDFQVQIDANKILSIIEKPVNDIKLPPINISASLGISIFPQDGNSVDLLVTAADTALYKAKKSKEEQWVKYDSSMSESINRRLLLKESFKSAISTNDYYTVFQPQVDTISNEIIGLEVLSRWIHPELGTISPNEFIEIAEETGQIRLITEHVIDSSLSVYNKWKKISGFSGRIAFNISAPLLYEASFVSFLLYQLDKHSIPKDTMEIEITESVQIFSSSLLQQHMREIHESGIRITMDDFGVGYSNLAYLNNLPISKINIDRFFVRSIGDNRKTEAILQTLIILANKLGIDVMAEGVETKEQLDFLTANNCTQVQGYYYDKPLNDDQFTERLQQYGISYPINAQMEE